MVVRSYSYGIISPGIPSIHQPRIYPARNITQFQLHFCFTRGACGGFTPDLSCFAKRIYIHSGGSSRRESIQFFLNPFCTLILYDTLPEGGKGWWLFLRGYSGHSFELPLRFLSCGLALLLLVSFFLFLFLFFLFLAVDYLYGLE